MVIDDVGWSVVFSDPLDEMCTNFWVSVGMVQISHWLFAFAHKECKDQTAELGSLFACDSCIDCIFAEAAEGVVLEVSSGGFVFGVLKAVDNACTRLALQSSALKGMAWSAFMILKGNIRFEK